MRLSFHGAAEEVTGSCFLIETDNGKLLIDCGMHQGERICSAPGANEFQFAAESVTAVVVTHAHFDHTGRLPLLMKRGFGGTVFSTPPTKALAQIILDDSVNIMRENAKKCGDEVLFGADEVAEVMRSWTGVGYHTSFEPIPGVTVMFHDAGHILGSAYITVDVAGHLTKDGKDARFLFSGDIGNDDVPILPDTEAIHRADYVICETTYGDRDHEPTSERGVKLQDFASLILKRGGTLLIPAFSVERTQELLFELDLLVQKKVLPRVPVYLDSPLAIRATDIYRHFSQYLKVETHRELYGGDLFSFPGLHETLRSEESRLINDNHSPKIIVAGNGMMTGGRIMHHLKRYLSDEKSGVLVIGFQAPHTLGRKILEGIEKVTIFGDEIPVRATVRSIESFSAHGDRSKLARWLQPEEGKIRKVFLVHGEADSKRSFADYVKKHTSAEIVMPRVFEVFEF